MTDIFGHLPPPPLALNLAALLGGTFDGDAIHVGAHVITSRPTGRVVLDGVTELGRHYDGPAALAKAYHAATEAVAS